MDKRIKLLILLSLMSADLIITLWALSNSYAREANPIHNFIWSMFGYTIGPFVSILFNSALLALFTYAENTGLKALAIFIATYGIIFLNNIRVLTR